MIRVQCVECDCYWDVTEDLNGKTVFCPKCGTKNRAVAGAGPGEGQGAASEALEPRRPQEGRKGRRSPWVSAVLIIVGVLVLLWIGRAVVGGFMYVKEVEEAKRRVATEHVRKTLTMAVLDYKLDHGEWPEKLNDLLERSLIGRGPYIDNVDAVIDPWGKPYEYNKEGPNNNGLKPDIWCITSEGPIGNWLGGR